MKVRAKAKTTARARCRGCCAMVEIVEQPGKAGAAVLHPLPACEHFLTSDGKQTAVEVLTDRVWSTLDAGAPN